MAFPQNTRALRFTRGAPGGTVDTRVRLAKLYQPFGRVTLDADASADELDRFHRVLARDYASNPDLR